MYTRQALLRSLDRPALALYLKLTMGKGIDVTGHKPADSQITYLKHQVVKIVKHDFVHKNALCSCHHICGASNMMITK